MDLPIHYPSSHWTTRKQARLEYVKRQKGKCLHCGRPLTGPPSLAVLGMRVDIDLFPPGFFNHPVHLHHDHGTGMTKGAVHARCNAVLWQYLGE